MKKIVVWNDVLWRSGLLDSKFKERLKEYSLDGCVTIHWWRYKPFEQWYPGLHPLQGLQFTNTRPELGLSTWVAPTPGYQFRIPRNADEEGFLSKTYSLLKMGYRDGSEGAVAYSVYDPSFYENILALAEFSWNQESDITIDEFKYKYLKLIGGSSDEERKTLDEYERVRKDADFIIKVPLNKLLCTTEIPKELLDPERLEGILDICRRAKGIISAAMNHKLPLILSENVMANLVVECDWIASKVGLFHTATLLIYEYNTMVKEWNGKKDRVCLASLKERIEEFKKEAEFHGTVMAELEAVKEDYNVPNILSYETGMMEYIDKFCRGFESIYRQIEEGIVEYLPIWYGVSPTLFGTGGSGLSRVKIE